MASEVTPEVRALKEVAPESRVDCTVDRELSSDSAVDVLTEADRPVDWVVDRSVETLASADTLAETLDETDTSPESAAETDSARVDAALDVTLAEFRVLISEETPVEATVRRLVWVDTPEDTLVSKDRLALTAVCSAVVWVSASAAPVETAFVKVIAFEMPVFSAVTCDSTDDVPIVVVDSEEDRLVKALRPEETWALVGDAPSVTMVERALEKSTPSEVVPEKLVLFRVAPERTVEAGAETLTAADSA